MNDRIVTLAGSLMALVIVAVILFPRTAPKSEDTSTPTTEDRGQRGLLALKHWLDANQVPTATLKRRYTSLATDDRFERKGNLLVVALPQSLPARHREHAALRDWIARGNTALILGDDARFQTINRFADTLKVRVRTDFNKSKTKKNASGEINKEKDVGTLSPLDVITKKRPDQVVILEPHLPYPVTEGIERLEVRVAPNRRFYSRLESDKAGRVILPLIGRTDDKEIVFSQMRVGKGTVWVSLYGSLFSNRALGWADNAKLAANLVAHSVTTHGTVIFDDMHLGLSELYDPEAFFNDQRLHTSILLIIGFWLLCVVGRSRRLAPPRAKAVRFHAGDLTKAVAGLFARRLGLQNTAKQLLTHFFDDIRKRHRLPTNGEPVWDILQEDARVEKTVVNALRQYHNRLKAGGTVDLDRLASLIQTLRKQST